METRVLIGVQRSLLLRVLTRVFCSHQRVKPRLQNTQKQRKHGCVFSCGVTPFISLENGGLCPLQKHILPGEISF